MRYQVEIKETLSITVDVEADNEQEAVTNVKRKYNEEKIVIGSEDYIDTEFELVES